MPSTINLKRPSKKKRSNKPVLASFSSLLNQHLVRKEAKRLREKIIAEEKILFLSEYNEYEARKLVNQSFLRNHEDGFPSDDPLLVMAFNLHVVNKAVEHLCNSKKTPLEAVFIASQIAETSNNVFIDPRMEAKQIKYLSASKEMGYFFTPPEIALLMASKILDNAGSATVLDPAAGYGVLLVATMHLAFQNKISIPSLTAIEIDSFTCSNLIKLLHYTKASFKLDCDISVINADAVESLSTASKLNTKFDRIIMNPPYGRLRFLKSFLTNAETRVSTERSTLDEQEIAWKKKIEHAKNKIKTVASHLGLKKSLNEFSKIFMALSLESLAEGGQLAIISPSSWLGDKESFDLRRVLIKNEWIKELILFREDSDLFSTVNQPTVVTILEKRKCNQFVLNSGIYGHSHSTIRYDDVRELEPKWLKIPRIPPKLFEAYKVLNSHKKIRDIPVIKNARGELDLSLHKHLIASEKSELRLIRGDHIERYVTRPSEASAKDSYVTAKSFKKEFRSLPKFQDTKNWRIAGRQCSYMDKSRRLSFSIVPPHIVLGNSCNYLLSDTGDKSLDEVTLWALLGFLNSSVLEWYFRIYNSNNHVANYEIDDFPLALDDSAILQLLAKSTQLLCSAYKADKGMSKKSVNIENFHDAVVAFAYGLSPEMIYAIVETLVPERASIVANMVEQIGQGNLPDLSNVKGWFNHFESRLSDLDREMIKPVPQGGNWMNIPNSVPSKRLEQIRHMTKVRGVVRTTYYGRLKPDQPSYTIATYFNRPGNGTNIHPWEDRTISLREAARLQSFPDSYIFLGSEASIRKQIGNAVPPLLAYSVGKEIAKYKKNGTCIDAFAGSGGLSIGLELAGWKSICAFDNDKQAAQTYCFNRPSTRDIDNVKNRCYFMERDMHEIEAQEEIILTAKKLLGGKELDLLVGGPPCQGFSHAGFRKHDDMRNDLARIYLELAAELNPNTIVLENVEGLLSFNNGQVVKDLIRTLIELGYKVSERPWLLCAEEYGVPQMRRRVMIVANKDQIIEPPPAIFQKCAGRREKIEELSINTLPYPLTVLDALHDLDSLGKRTHKGIGKRPIRSDLSLWYKGIIDTETLLNTNNNPVTYQGDFLHK